MSETLILLAPGEERLIRVRCTGLSNSSSLLTNTDSPLPTNAKEVITEPVQGIKSRKNRKENGATRKNRKQSGGNSYFNFAKTERKEVLSKHPELKSDVVAVARKIGEAWRKLSEAERKKY